MLLRIFYNLITALLAPVVGLVFLFYRRGRVNLLQRFGFWPAFEGKNDYIWIHAASAGEVGGVLPILTKLRERGFDSQILLTSTSPTGLQRAQSACTWQMLLPFDCQIFYRLALRGKLPRALFISEVDFWPELITFLSERGVKIFIVNARISSTYMRSYSWTAFFMRPVLQRITAYYCQDLITRDRLHSMGVAEKATVVCGNSKFDDLQRYIAGEKLSFDYSSSRPLVVLGSLRPGEDQYWIPICKKFSSEFNFIFVPRHLEFLKQFKGNLEQHGISPLLWSEVKETDDHRISSHILVDSIGELLKFYSIADLAFVGGTLCDGFGGHNPLEPVVFNVPVLIGPFNANQEGLFADLCNLKAVSVVKNSSDIEELLMKFKVQRSAAFANQCQAAFEYLRTQAGAASRLADLIMGC
jgi:3-deoxy-D-manno-octulosonic-acid transferase